MKEKRISFCQGKGSLTHNNREFIAENIDRNRIKDNVIFIRQDLGKAYDQLFAESTERYNAKQKRNDRKIHGTYYESLFHQKPSNTVVTAADKRKSFYEDVVQIGKMDDSGVSDYPLWIRCTQFEPDHLDWKFWQYSDKGKLEGYYGTEPCIDFNVFSGTVEELKQLKIED